MLLTLRSLAAIVTWGGGGRGGEGSLTAIVTGGGEGLLAAIVTGGGGNQKKFSMGMFRPQVQPLTL